MEKKVFEEGARELAASDKTSTFGGVVGAILKYLIGRSKMPEGMSLPRGVAPALFHPAFLKSFRFSFPCLASFSSLKSRA